MWRGGEPNGAAGSALASAHPPRLRQVHQHLFRGASLAAVAMAVQAVGGFAYWLVAARVTDASAVGGAAALMSASAFVMYATNLGLAFTVGRFAVTDAPQDRLTFALAAVLTAVTSGIGSALYWVLLGNPSASAGSDAATLAALVAATSLVSMAQLVDIRLMAVRRVPLVVARAVVVAIARTGLLVATPFGDGGVALFVMAVAPDAITALLGAGWLSRGSLRSLLAGVRPARLRTAVRYSVFAHFSAIAMSAPTFVVPIIVLSYVSDETYGSFYIAWSIANVVLLVPHATMLALHVEGGREGADVGTQLRVAVRLTVASTLVCFAGSFVAAPLVTSIFGSDFAEAGRLAPWLVAGTVPWGVTLLLLGEARVHARYWASLRIAAVNAACCVVPIYLLTRADGLDGVGLAWVLGTSSAAAIAVVFRAKTSVADVLAPSEVMTGFTDEVTPEVEAPLAPTA